MEFRFIVINSKIIVMGECLKRTSENNLFSFSFIYGKLVTLVIEQEALLHDSLQIHGFKFSHLQTGDKYRLKEYVLLILKKHIFFFWGGAGGGGGGVSFTNIRDSKDDKGKGEDISVTPLHYFHSLHRHLDISRAIIAEDSTLHVASSRTRTRKLLDTERNWLTTKLRKHRTEENTYYKWF